MNKWKLNFINNNMSDEELFEKGKKLLISYNYKESLDMF